MHWYGGSMAEAVTLSKQRNAIFVVFIEDENQLSKEMAATIDDSAILNRLSNENNFLAVKLKSGSENYTFFAQIYQFVPVPSLFFIGRNGTPLEVVCPGVPADQLATRIDRILQEHRKEHGPPGLVQPSTSSRNLKEETVNFMQTEASALKAQSQPAKAEVEMTPEPVPPSASQIQDEEPETSSGPAPKIQKTEHHEVTKSGQEYDVICDGDVCVRRPKIDQAGPSQRTDAGPVQIASEMESESAASVEEKMDRAKELIEARRREKAEKEKEQEKQKEIERRSVGQGVAELKKWQAEQEFKQIQEERKREKMENNLARQRILEQIAQDRAERRAREQPAAPAAPLEQNQPTSVGDSSGRARVQFKLPDGSAHTAHFEATAALAEVQRYVADNLQMGASSFSLWTAFPRRELTEPRATLLELQLAPSAALLVLPRRADAVPAAPTTFASIISFFTQLFTTIVLDPSYQIYNWLRARVFPAPSIPPSSPTPPTPPTNPTPSSNPSAGLRRRGNIHRLTEDRSNDDDNNTWNGNSTQQM